MSLEVRRLFRVVAGVTLAVSTLFSATGCASEFESQPPFANGDVPIDAASDDCDPHAGKERTEVTREVAVVIAPTKSFVRFSNAIGAAETELRSLLNQSGAQVSTVLANGSPIAVFKRTTDFSEAVFQADKDKEVSASVGKVRYTYYCTVMTREQNPNALPSVEGADFISSLQVAAESMTHLGVQKNIMIIGNGLQDVGQLDLTTDFPADTSSAREYARGLASKGGLPDLTGVKVSWYGLGQTAQGNARLHPAAQKSLEALWTALIEEAGGELVKVVSTIPYADPVETSIQVKPIDVPAPPCVFMLTSDDGFNFKPDSAEFLNTAKAQKGAEAMAAEIGKSNCSGPLYVVGYAASGVDKRDYNASAAAKVKSISASRAVAFKGLLEKAGVSIKLVPVGAGKGPIIDWDISGKFVEDMGKQNRFVEVTQSKPETN